MNRLSIAIGCLTILPFGPRGDVQEADLGGSMFWFPLVGLFIGCGLIGVQGMIAKALPPLATSAFLLLAWVVMTGALHLDGVGDVADGLYGGRTPEARLRIMKDPHVGAMAVVALATLLLVKCSLVGSLAPNVTNRALLFAPCIGRYGMVLLGSTLPYARVEGGTAASFVKHSSTRTLVGATAIALLAALLLFGPTGFAFFGLALIGSLALRQLFLATLGGITGDALGATCELLETLMLALIIAAAR